ncbi:MAG: hypothetical protein WCS70_07525 [Verrucomicrobiota bacterium]
MIKNSLCAIGLSLALGCATASVRPYVGEQQTWPTANGAIVSIRYDLPVFTSLPPAPYEVLAELRINSPLYAQPVEGHLSTLVKKGVELGADALVFVDGQVFFSTQYGIVSGDASAGGAAVKQASISQVNRFNPDSFRQGVTIVAIRWVDQPPVGLPPRYAKYSNKMLTNEPPAVSTSPAIQAPPQVEPPHTNIQSKAAPAAPAIPEPPKAEVAPAPAAPATPEVPKAEVTPPAVAAPNLALPATPAAEEPKKTE